MHIYIHKRGYISLNEKNGIADSSDLLRKLLFQLATHTTLFLIDLSRRSLVPLKYPYLPALRLKIAHLKQRTEGFFISSFLPFVRECSPSLSLNRHKYVLAR